MSVYIVVAATLVLVLMAGYFFLSHSIEQNHLRRQQLITALRAKRNTLRDLATDFPAGFLPKQLNLLLYSTLIDACEQLSQIEPSDPQHAEQLRLFTGLFANQKSIGTQSSIKLSDPQKIREARHLLQEFNKHLQHQASLQLVNPNDALLYSKQINQLIVELSADAYSISANEAQQMGKPNLAHHYFVLAKKTLLLENNSRSFDQQIAQLSTQIELLEEAMNIVSDQQAPMTNEADSPETLSPTLSKEWEKVLNPNDDWKKKQDYD